jgi:ribonuclease D
MGQEGTKDAQGASVSLTLSRSQPRFVTDVVGVTELAAALLRASFVALDTESNSMHVYREQVCLLQVNVDGDVFVVDPLALGVDPRRVPSDVLSPLRKGLRREDRPLYLHGGEYDVACLRRDFDLVLGGVFDTQQAASLLGFEKTGYGTLVERFCGVALPKAYTTYDWGTRPLDTAALSYAVDDVVYLPEVAKAVQQLVHAAGIDDEVSIANEVVASTPRPRGFDPSSLWRLRDVDHASPSTLKVLLRLLAWREAAAAEENLPAGRLVNNEVLCAVARQKATTIAGLKKAGLRTATVDRYGDAALAAIHNAEFDEVPQRPSASRQNPVAQAREVLLKRWRREEAARRSEHEGRPIPLSLVLPAKALEALCAQSVCDLAAVPQLGTARRRRYGKDLERLCSVVDDDLLAR